MKKTIHLTKFTNKLLNPSDNDAFAGVWCLNKSQLLNIKKVKLLKYHWEDLNKFEKDILYLNNIYSNLLEDLSRLLTKTIHIKYNKDNIKILLSHWLTVYLSVLFDRWSIIENIVKNDFSIISINNEIKITRPKVYIECVDLYQSSLWNEQLLREIYAYRYEKKNIDNYLYKNIYKSLKLTSKNNQKINPYKFFTYFNYLRFFNSKTHYHIDQNIMSFKNLLKFYLKYNISIHEIDNLSLLFEFNEENINNFHDLAILKKDKISFKNYVYKRILKDFPYSYIGTPINTKYKNKKTIFISGSKHQSCDLSKWNIIINKESKKNCFFYTSRHGGGFPASYPERFDQDELIADKCLTYFQSKYKNRIQVTNLRLKKHNSNTLLDNLIFSKKRKQITLVGFENLKFCHKLAYAYISQNYLNYLNLIDKTICYIINNTNYECFFRPYSKRNSWYNKERLIKKFEDKIYFNEKKNFIKSIKGQNLVICTYPQTTFSECLYLNIPTVLLFDPKIWKIDQDFTNLLEEMIKEKIVHTNFESLRNFLDMYSNNFNNFWNTKNVQELILKYKNMCLGYNHKSYSAWENIFNQ